MLPASRFAAVSQVEEPVGPLTLSGIPGYGTPVTRYIGRDAGGLKGPGEMGRMKDWRMRVFGFLVVLTAALPEAGLDALPAAHAASWRTKLSSAPHDSMT